MDPQFAALVTLHAGMPRQGPGDETLASAIIDTLPLPERPRVADLGSGSGAGALLLARRLGVPVVAIDLAVPFLRDLQAGAGDLAHLCHPVAADMAAPPLAPASLDLLWSEGAAYALGFGPALAAWRPLLRPGGIAVVSEMTWFTATPSADARDFWSDAYPAMGTEEDNRRRAQDAGFSVKEVRRLPREAWGPSYYDPLRERIAALEPAAPPALAAVIAEMRREMDLFDRYGDQYGYAFFVLAAR